MRVLNCFTASFLFLTSFTSAGIARRADSLSQVSTSVLSNKVSTTSLRNSTTTSRTISNSSTAAQFGGNFKISAPLGPFVNATATLNSSVTVSETPSSLVNRSTSTSALSTVSSSLSSSSIIPTSLVDKSSERLSATRSDTVSSSKASSGLSETPSSVPISSTRTNTTRSAGNSTIPSNRDSVTSSFFLSTTSSTRASEVSPTQSKLLSTITLPGPFPSISDPLAGLRTTSSKAALPSSVMSLFSVGYVVIDGETYIISRSGSFKLLQEDESEIILSPTFIQKGEEKLPLPANIEAPSASSLQGVEIKFEPGKKPRQGKPRSKDEVSNVFKGLGGAIKNVVSSVNDAVKHAENLSKAPNSGFMSGLSVFEQLLSGVGSSLNTVTDTLETIDSIELDDLSGSDRALVVQAHESAAGLTNWRVSVNKLIRQLKALNPPTFPGPVFDHLRRNLFKYMIPPVLAVDLGIYIKNLQAFEEKNTGKIIVIPTPTTSSVVPITPTNIEDEITRTTRTTETSTKTSSSSSSSAPPDPTFLCTIRTKEGTSRETFDKFTKTLDNNAGVISAHEFVEAQTYMTYLTLVDKKLVEIMPFIDFVVVEPPINEADKFYGFEFYKSPDNTSKNQSGALGWSNPSQELQAKHSLDKRDLITRQNSDSHLKILSQIRAVRDADYVADDSLGRGTTIYILDSGFATLPELNTANRRVTAYAVPNGLSLQGVPQAHWLPETSRARVSSHGTCVASVAAGVVHGVASNADLHLVKIKGEHTNEMKVGQPDQDKPLLAGLRLAAVLDALDHVKGHVKENKRQGKAVVNLSWGVSIDKGFDRILRSFIDWCADNGVVLVTAAGNDGEDNRFLHEFIPQQLGSEDNILITVGGTHQDGSLWRRSRPKAAGKEGSISIYAQGSDIKCSGLQGEVMDEAGTSFSSAAISGLAAYLISLRTVNTGAPTVDVANQRGREIKNKLSSLAWVRFDDVINPAIYPDMPKDFGLPIPDRIPVAYNDARGSPDSVPPPPPPSPPGKIRCPPQKRDESQEGACSVSVEAPTTSSQIIPTSSIPSESPTTTQGPGLFFQPPPSQPSPSQPPTPQPPPQQPPPPDQGSTCNIPADLPTGPTSPVNIEKDYFRVIIDEKYTADKPELAWTIYNDQNKEIVGRTTANDIKPSSCRFPYEMTIKIDESQSGGNIFRQTLKVAMASDPSAHVSLVPSDFGGSPTATSNQLGTSATCLETAPWNGQTGADGTYSGSRTVQCYFVPQKGSGSNSAPAPPPASAPPPPSLDDQLKPAPPPLIPLPGPPPNLPSPGPVDCGFLFLGCILPD